MQLQDLQTAAVNEYMYMHLYIRVSDYDLAQCESSVSLVVMFVLFTIFFTESKIVVCRKVNKATFKFGHRKLQPFALQNVLRTQLTLFVVYGANMHKIIHVVKGYTNGASLLPKP